MQNVKVQVALSIFTAFVEILFFGGVIFGFSSLQYVLEKEGYFEYLCENSNLTSLNSTTANNVTITINTAASNIATTCGEQDASFNLVFTLGSSFLFFAAFPSGYLLDRFGTWIFRTVITTLYTLAYILLAISTPTMSNLLYPSLMLFGIAGLGLLMSNYQLANLASSVRGSLLTFMNGLFSSSVVVFLSIKKGYDAGISLYLMLTIMTCLTIFLWLRNYFLLPRKSIPFPLPSEKIQYGWKEMKCRRPIPSKQVDIRSSFPKLGLKNTLSNDHECKATDKCQTADMSQISFASSLKNILFWTNAFHYSVIALRLSFLFSTLLPWLRSFENPKNISELTDNFGVILLFGICISPLNGFLIDTVRRVLKSRTDDEKLLNLSASFVSMFATSCISIIYSVMILIPSAYGSFIFHLLTRGFVHGGHATFIAINFPFYHFGKLYGLAGVVAGAVSLLQYALFQVYLSSGQSFYFINIGFLVVSILTLVHPVAIYIQAKRYHKNFK